MTETALLLGSILVATSVLGISAVVSLAGQRPRLPARRRVGPVPAKVVCPATDELVWVEIAPDPVTRGATVSWCERFPVGPIECDRSCFPALAA